MAKQLGNQTANSIGMTLGTGELGTTVGRLGQMSEIPWIFMFFFRFATRKVVSLAMENGPSTVDLASKMVIFHSYVRVVSGKLKIQILGWGPDHDPRMHAI